MVWVTFVGGAAAGRRGEHIAITEIVDMFPFAVHQAADFVGQLIATIVLCLLVWYGIVISKAVWVDILPVLGWPMSFEYLAMPIGSAATLIFVLYDLTQIARGVSRNERYGE